MQPTNNAAVADGSAAECSSYFPTGPKGAAPAGPDRLEGRLLDALAALMCALALYKGWAATRDLAWPCDVDLYRDIGFARSMLDGHPLSDPLYLGELLWYTPLVPALIALAAGVTGLPVHQAATQLGFLLNLAAPLGFYLLMLRLLGRRTAMAALASFLFIAPGDFPSWAAATYSPWLFPNNFVQALFYLGLWSLHHCLTGERRQSRWWLASGALLGLCLLGHGAPALLLGLVMGVAVLWLLARPSAGAGPALPGGPSRRATLVRAAAALAAAFVVALPYTYSVLFHYGLDVKNSEPGSWIWVRLDLRTLPALLQDLRHPVMLLPAAGLVLMLARARGPWARPLLVTWLLASGGMVFYSYFWQSLKNKGISAPVIVPGYHFHFYYKALEAALVGHSLVLLAGGLSALARALALLLARSAGERRDPRRELGALVGVLLLTLGLAYPVYRDREGFTSERDKARKLTPSPAMAAAFRWIRDNTRPEDVFLASDHYSLHLLSPAGRKVVAMIPFFSNPFVPWERRHEDRGHLFSSLYMGHQESFAARAKRYQLTYVIEEGSPAVKMFGSSMNFLQKAFHEGDIWIFKVNATLEAPTWWLPPEEWEPPDHP